MTKEEALAAAKAVIDSGFGTITFTLPPGTKLPRTFGRVQLLSVRDDGTRNYSVSVYAFRRWALTSL